MDFDLDKEISWVLHEARLNLIIWSRWRMMYKLLPAKCNEDEITVKLPSFYLDENEEGHIHFFQDDFVRYLRSGDSHLLPTIKQIIQRQNKLLLYLMVVPRDRLWNIMCATDAYYMLDDFTKRLYFCNGIA